MNPGFSTRARASLAIIAVAAMAGGVFIAARYVVPDALMRLGLRSSGPESIHAPYRGAPVNDLAADPSVVAQAPHLLGLAEAELDDLDAKLAEDPGQIELWKRVASIKHFFNDDLGARDAYEYVNQIAPGDALAFYNLGLIYGYNLKEPAKAEAKLARALELSPFAASFYLGFANFHRDVRGDAPRAEAILRDAYGFVPLDPSIHTALALLLREKGDSAGALEFYQKALATGDLSAGERAAIEAAVVEIERSM